MVDYVWFNEKGSKERSMLYKLENMNIVRLTRKDVKSPNKAKLYEYGWILTKKGQELVDENKYLQEIWGDGNKVIIEGFYQEVLRSLNEIIELKGGLKK